jgi:hypothetical protein
MAGITGDLRASAEVGFIDLVGHRDHLAGGILGGFVVRLHLARDVAEGAFHAKGNRNKLHSRADLVGGNVLEDGEVLRGLRGGKSAVLRLQGAGGEKDEDQDSVRHGFSAFYTNHQAIDFGKYSAIKSS